MSKFFINRPVFAWVVSIFIILAGLVMLRQLPVSMYPSVAAPKIQISTLYPGASAKTHQDMVISIIEREMNGIEGLDYMVADSGAGGMASLSLTFVTGTDINLAQVEVQNRLARAEPRLPQIVRQIGVNVNKSQSNFLMIVSLIGKEGSNKKINEIADYAVRYIQPELQRVEGVGSVQVFASENAMRIWIDPERLRGFGLSVGDVRQALQSQNIQISAGAIGAEPSLAAQTLTATVNIDGQLRTVEDFQKVVIRALADGSTVRLKDVARVELGQDFYVFGSRVNGHEAVHLAVMLANDGNASATATRVRTLVGELSKFFPADIESLIPFDTSKFVDISINKVFHTLIEALLFVVIVMFIFLQKLRYTLIPAIVVPISLLGAVILMGIFEMSLNVLTMFAMVLVIGIVVDDAIVVVENVERLMAEEGLNPYQAAMKSADQITGAIVGITTVLIAVFIPMTFFSGATGNIYRQFSLVMAVSIAFSGFFALTLTPALCATLLKPVVKSKKSEFFLFRFFNKFLVAGSRYYERFLAKLIKRSYFMMLIYLMLAAGAGYIYLKLPPSFLPSEDQGVLIVNIQLPPGATLNRTKEALQQVEKIIIAQPEVEHVAGILGFNFSGQGANMGLAMITLKDWKQRTEAAQHADALAKKLTGLLASSVRDAMVFAVNLPPIPELGSSLGFSAMLQDRHDGGHENLLAARNQILGMARNEKALSGVRPGGVEDAAQMRVTIDREAAFAQGVSLATIAQTVSAYLGSDYVGDFSNKGRSQKVTLMVDSPFRMQGEDILAYSVPNNRGEAVSLGNLTSISWENGAMQLMRYNGYPAMEITGNASAGYSTGDAMLAVEQLAQRLPSGYNIAWTGQSLEEKRAGSQSYALYAFSIIAVFLILAALYESWSIPLAVVMVIPLGFLGVVLGVWWRGMENDVYFQVGLLTVMGLSAKNAILIIEFAKDLQQQGMSAVKAALAAAHLRFRPIMMTSIAFIAGVVPLFFAEGASSASQRVIGTGVLSGMAIGTLLTIFFVPIYYIVVRKIFKVGKRPHERFVKESSNESTN